MIVVTNPVVGFTGGPDDALWYVEPYVHAVYEHVASRGLPTTYLYASEATRERLWRAMELQPSVAVLAGHGEADRLGGYANQPVLWVGMHLDGFSPWWVKGCTVLALSCETAAALGPYVVALGARSYLGWSAPFALVVNHGTRKGADILSSPDLAFLLPVEEAFKRVAAGEWSARQAFDYIKAQYTLTAANPLIPLHWKALLLSDAATLTLIGEGAAPELRLPAWALAPAIAAAVGLGLALSGL